MTPAPDTRTVSVEQLQRWHSIISVGAVPQARSTAIAELQSIVASAAPSPGVQEVPHVERTDKEWLDLPEIKAKFVDYAEAPTDANALRIIQAAKDRAIDSQQEGEGPFDDLVDAAIEQQEKSE